MKFKHKTGEIIFILIISFLLAILFTLNKYTSIVSASDFNINLMSFALTAIQVVCLKCISLLHSYLKKNSDYSCIRDEHGRVSKKC